MWYKQKKTRDESFVYRFATCLGMGYKSAPAEVQEAISQWGTIASELHITKETRNTIQSAMDKIRD